uniref:Uncharacterized protein n=1 Tax=Megaselia scalaris TaxID=36166 RepID=T1GZ63_MEGSC
MKIIKISFFLVTTFISLSVGDTKIDVKQYQKCIYSGMSKEDITALMGAGRLACRSMQSSDPACAAANIYPSIAKASNNDLLGILKAPTQVLFGLLRTVLSTVGALNSLGNLGSGLVGGLLGGGLLGGGLLGGGGGGGASIGGGLLGGGGASAGIGGALGLG